MQTIGTQHYHVSIGTGRYDPYEIMPLPGYVAEVIFDDPGKAFDTWVGLIERLNTGGETPENISEWKQEFMDECFEGQSGLHHYGAHLIEVYDCWNCHGESNN